MPESEGPSPPPPPAQPAHNPQLRCITCSYALADLPFAGVCPECGVTYDKAELEVLWHEKTMAWLNPTGVHMSPPAAKRAMKAPLLSLIAMAVPVASVAIAVDLYVVAFLVLPSPLIAYLVIIAMKTSKLTLFLESVQDCACTNCAFDLRFRPDVGVCPSCRNGYQKAACRAAWKLWRLPNSSY
ncbi:MAG: hypothetical protein K2W85_10960 [Phycisphaerales bacterium]|nr:hypothetical protein [Phycisphaerales bacterium]